VDGQGQTSSTGDKHNGADYSETAWANGAVTGHAWPPASGAPAPEHASAGALASGWRSRDDDTAQWSAAGLGDDTPHGGVAAVEPPLWREAARHAATSSAPPAAPAPSSAPPATRGRAAPIATGSTSHAPPTPPAWDRPASHNGAHAAQYPPPAAPGAAEPTDPAAGAARPDAPARRREPDLADLPQRVPSEPDVPDSGEPWRALSPAEAPQLARIADQLRRDDVPPGEPREGFDVDAVLDAVRGVEGVRAASLRPSRNGAHTLRLDLADDADPVQVSRVVARLLQERMGLSAAPQHVPHQRGPEDTVTRPETVPVPVADPPPDLAEEAEARLRPLPPAATGPRVVIDQVQVNVEGLDATVEVRLVAGPHRALGLASGPAIDSYVVRLAAISAARAVDELMREAGRMTTADDSQSRCFVEHTGVVPFGSTEVAVVVVLLVCGGWVEQLAGSAVVDGDARQAAVRATLGAVNRRLDALLA
jgi:hypothetical protein